MTQPKKSSLSQQEGFSKAASLDSKQAPNHHIYHNLLNERMGREERNEDEYIDSW